MDVKPFMLDITQSVVPGALNSVNYHCLMQDIYTGEWVEPPASQSGYIILSSNMVFYTLANPQQVVVSSSSSSPASNALTTGVIAGIVLGSIAAVAIFMALVVYSRYHFGKSNAISHSSLEHSQVHESPLHNSRSIWGIGFHSRLSPVIFIFEIPNLI